VSFRVGIVKTLDAQNVRVRVTFPAHNQMTSWWLPVCIPKSQNDKAYWMPDVGEQVVCLMDEHDEDGAVLGSIYSTADTAPASSADKWHVTMKDGAAFEYDRSTHTLAIEVPASGTLNITVHGGNINLSAPDGDITFKTSEHTDSVNNMIDTYNAHTHDGVQSGSSDTTSPHQQMSREDALFVCHPEP
jgi:phage baseplate assembly protein V